jgi:hypothetical protein
MDAFTDRPEEYAFFVDSAGDMFVYHAIATEQLQGWVKWTTNGSFKSIAGVNDTLFVYCERSIDGATVHWLESLDETVTVDGAVIKTAAPATGIFTGITEWANETVDVVIDGPDGTQNNYYLGTVVITGAGGLTLPNSATSTRAVVGYKYDATLKMMPITLQADEGEILTEPKRVVSVTPILDSAYVIELDGNRMEIKGVSDDFSTDAVPFTGLHRFYNLGWDRRGEIQLDVNDPLDVTLLGVSRETVF